MKVELRNGYCTEVDEADAPLVRSMAWYRGCNGYVHCSVWDPKNKVRRNLSLHRFLLNPPDGLQVDHINNDPLDNRRANLRIATRSQNARNRPNARIGRSGFRGVYWYPQTKRWKASVYVDGKHRHIGYFTCKVEAAKAYNRRAPELAGPFVVLNNLAVHS